MNFPILFRDKSKIPYRSILKIGTIITLVIVVTLMHYLTTPNAGIRHVFFRELYFLPIIFAGFWFGLRGGLSTAFIISIFYAPLIFSGREEFSTHDFGNAMEILLFILVGGLLGWLRDRQVLQQSRLREAENLAAMGRATAMIAHDLKTPLITIAGLARRLSGKFPPASSEGEKVMVIRQQAERLEKLVMEMLFFAKPMKLSLEPSDLYHLLAEAKKAVQEIMKNSEVNIDLPTETPCTCHFDHEKMMLVIVNLFSNAIEASAGDENITVLMQDDSDKISIEISDRGTGIPENIKENIFEPFVTGKPKGTGLGLPICKKIVEAHSGHLEYSNNADGGTTFRILLPKA